MGLSTKYLVQMRKYYGYTVMFQKLAHPYFSSNFCCNSLCIDPKINSSYLSITVKCGSEW